MVFNFLYYYVFSDFYEILKLFRKIMSIGIVYVTYPGLAIVMENPLVQKQAALFNSKC